MKRLTLHRLASALLCLTLALSLTACGGKKKPAPAAGNSGVKETISDSRTDQTGQADPVKPSEPEAEVDPKLVEECLDKLGFDLEYGGYPGAAASRGSSRLDEALRCLFRLENITPTTIMNMISSI